MIDSRHVKLAPCNGAWCAEYIGNDFLTTVHTLMEPRYHLLSLSTPMVKILQKQKHMAVTLCLNILLSGCGKVILLGRCPRVIHATMPSYLVR